MYDNRPALGTWTIDRVITLGGGNAGVCNVFRKLGITSRRQLRPVRLS